MGDDSIIEIIIFAVIAGFLIFRLRSVLGRRTGEERQRPNPLERKPGGAPEGATVIPLPERGPRPVEHDGPKSLAQQIADLRRADPSFDEQPFLGGARSAFEMIVGAFAQGDIKTLRPLLADQVYENFATAIRDRTSRGETLETVIANMISADIAEARLDGTNALVTVRYVTEQTNVVRDASGAILDGEPGKPIEVVDLWTFARDTQSRDPNWALVATRTP